MLANLEPAQALDASITAYGLRHLPEHLKRAGQDEALARALTDFFFAMRRADGGALEHALQDYQDHLLSQPAPVESGAFGDLPKPGEGA